MVHYLVKVEKRGGSIVATKPTFADLVQSLTVDEQATEEPAPKNVHKRRNQGKQYHHQKTYQGHSQQAHPMTSRSKNSFDRSVNRVIPLVHEKRTSKLSFSNILLILIVILLIIWLFFK